MATIRHRRDTTDRWEYVNPTLYDGEIGVDTTKKAFKLGDGITPWLGLRYFYPDQNNSVGDLENLIVDFNELEDEVHDHFESDTPHPVYDDIPSLTLLYQNAKV